ncbi:phosphoribosylanthranilate isomerase [Gynuella sunshinyii]|uniref:N-(5'-phosphoribosyl)anthranilate isomerase n=1 Tax=Gynuella sunshinyii YC6258 TaxID=1445510 RepID=A0A0C5VNL3_9GAMM|nr:phosphoribosylanthranilate isomerase [Gynuella sunshinyii]AJQ94988.1 phosphoribosylanthranilate isomerase [Gynuella sunshinyii YC6258]
MKVKICGLTNLEDALLACNAGADALGFVFYPPSARYVEPAQAAEIIKRLPPFITKVALFVDPEPEWVNLVLSQVAIDCIQFHGNESDEFCQQFCKPFIKALRVESKEFLDHQMACFPNASALLLDAFVEGIPGGTGQCFDWQLIDPELKKRHRLIVAGGLTPDNIRQAVDITSPYAVDVSGGVEQSKGKKDQQLLERFIAQAKA